LASQSSSADSFPFFWHWLVLLKLLMRLVLFIFT